MGRPRKNPKDNQLPPRVTRNKYSYVWKPKGTKLSITLGKISDSTMSKIWQRYEEEKAKRHDVMTFAKLWSKFLDSPTFTELAIRTQDDYRQHQKKLLAVFGKMKADDIKIEQVRIYMDKRGVTSKNQANQEVSSMSRVFGWGFERGYVRNNPCKGIRKFTLVDRDVYILDEDYLAIYEHARVEVQVAMEISYLCAAREGDVFDLKIPDLRADGIFIEQNKTGKKQIKKWTPRLQAAISLASRHFANKSAAGYVIPSPSGGRMNKKTFNTWWNNAKKAAALKLGRPIQGTFHDIKAKAISDYEGSSKEKQLFSGHKTENQVAIYDRKVRISPTLNIPITFKDKDGT
ncbi:TPA: tyrosine-type recombinase/integrase [Salmonella enterica subsp. enterica serovar Muenchen]|nr:tyrosine-type recombinase/integrase [Salmonella enterica subsp. enterica serovar Muenchen]HEC7516204.1 tyrosine-type recombinase/integrase [Salmonella enterica subsp. enterica serovar Muenchen]HEC7580236.1 tyrosine-type recombinase/integrase [Salmonella enterica subsp. enterica serovar Muenchen]HEC8713973.1 tyrosine-type recombinase/integrase [Salmonella enterica subsp. enterica serovar Muenchen]